jgi:hypothetical protein
VPLGQNEVEVAVAGGRAEIWHPRLMQLALMMIRGEGLRSTEQARRELVTVVRASVATLPRVVDASPVGCP